MGKQESCLEKETMQGTMPGACRRGRPCTAWMDNIKTWTGLPVEESVRMTEINGESASVVWPAVGPRTAKEQDRGRMSGSCIFQGRAVHSGGRSDAGREMPMEPGRPRAARNPHKSIKAGFAVRNGQGVRMAARSSSSSSSSS